MSTPPSAHSFLRSQGWRFRGDMTVWHSGGVVWGVASDSAISAPHPAPRIRGVEVGLWRLGFKVWRLATRGRSRPFLKKLLQEYLAHEKHPTPQDHHRSLSIGLLKGFTEGVFLMSKVPLYLF